MSRPELVAEVRILGVAVTKSRRGGGWIAGEPYLRKRRGEPGEEVVRPSYFADALSALYAALKRAEELSGKLGAEEGAEELLGALAGLLGASEAILGNPGSFVRRAREAAGLSKRALARLSGASRTTVQGIESGDVASPRVETVARLLKTCREEAR